MKIPSLQPMILKFPVGKMIHTVLPRFPLHQDFEFFPSIVEDRAFLDTVHNLQLEHVEKIEFEASPKAFFQTELSMWEDHRHRI